MGSAKAKKNTAESDHQKWELMLNALKQILHKQSNQLHSLLLQRNRANSHLRLLLLIISQKQRQLELSELRQVFQTTKADLLLASNQTDSLLTNLKLEHAQSELDDFKAWFDILSHRCPDKEDISPGRLYESLKKAGRHSTSNQPDKNQSELEKQVAALKEEYEKLSLKHKSDITALQDENKFVWNQYKDLEDQLKTRNDEIDRVNQNTTNLLKSMEQLQSASIEKDKTVATLRADNTKLEAELNAKGQEISALSKELKLLKSSSKADTPVLRQCTSLPSSSRSRGRKDGRGRNSATLKEEETSSKLLVSEQAVRRSKRKQKDVISIEDTPKLFTSQFKVPKLRSQSPHGR